jgi:hypothetical protein
MTILCVAALAALAAAPTDNPVGRYGLAWTGEIAWANVVTLTDVPGDTWDARLVAAQERLGAGGGVVYVPAGRYELADWVTVRSGVVIRGADPVGEVDARKEGYAPPTQFIFPQYKPTYEGNGTPNDTAFKGFRLADSVGGRQCGVVNIAIDHGHVAFVNADLKTSVAEGKAGRAIIVAGCVLRNAATPDEAVPADFQPKWQRWTQRHSAAIRVFTGGDVLVANNRIPFSGEANFVMKGYQLKGKTLDLTFDFDNRPGIYVNAVHAGRELDLWNDHTGAATPSPKPEPYALCTGLVIRDNFIQNTGCCAINVTGDGMLVAGNVIRFRKDVVIPTTGGVLVGSPANTNNNRAVELRGYRWTVEGNDYEVYSNLKTPGGGAYNDGEGLMHEGFNGCGIKDSKFLNNTGNRYICIWRVPVEGLEIRGNTAPNINVLSQTNPATGNKKMPCRNVVIVGNKTFGSGISINGAPSDGCVIKDNTQTTPGGKITLLADVATVEGNEGYTVEKR